MSSWWEGFVWVNPSVRERLPHCRLVTPYGVSDLGHHWVSNPWEQTLVTNFNQLIHNSFQQHAFESFIRKMSVNLLKVQYVDSWHEMVYGTFCVIQIMMTSSNGNITGPLWGESTGHRWIPLTKGSDAELWCFLWSVPEQTVEQAIETPMIWDVLALIMTSL